MKIINIFILAVTSFFFSINVCSLSISSDQKYMQQAELFKKNGNSVAAIEKYRKALLHNPTFFQAQFLLGVELCKQGQINDAITAFQQALKLQPNNVRVLFNLGIALEVNGNTNQAIENYKKALSLFPFYTKAHLQLANILKKDQPTESLKHYLIVTNHDPQHFDAHFAVAKMYCEQNNLSKSLLFFDKACGLKPENKEIDAQLASEMLQLGIKLFSQHQGKEAEHIFKKILSINNNFAAVHHNLAFTLAERLGNHYEALNHYKRAMEINPNNYETHFCFSLSCLAIGNLDVGWQEYKYRWLRPNNVARTFDSPLEHLWEGEDVRDKKIVIRCEQGLGDTLHFIRYAQLLKNAGAYVIAEVQKPLLKLLSLCPYLDNVIPIGHAIPMYDYQIPMLNLPAIFKTTLETIPQNIPYLGAMPALEKEWREYLEKDTNFKIGICWFGDAAHGQTKFMPLKDFAPLFHLENTSFYSLQKITGLDQLKDLPDDVTLHIFGSNFDKTFGSFMDTAAVIKSLDLVITADTSVAHLAGGLGVPTWIILPFPAEWRWLMHRQDSPWYPTARLFRQKKINDWQPVVKKLKKALREIIQKK